MTIVYLFQSGFISYVWSSLRGEYYKVIEVNYIENIVLYICVVLVIIFKNSLEYSSDKMSLVMCPH